MKARILLLTATLGLLILSTGCYTKLYRPGMEDQGPFSANTLYNRFDSTAIDTTLTKPETVDVYPGYGYYDSYGWSQWGRPRGYTRWGFDFDRFSPDYYRSYYGYYDYYGRPWWHDWNHNHNWWGGGGGSGGVSEPPSQRPGRRSSEVNAPPVVGGGGGYSAPPAYVQPSPPVVQPVKPIPPVVKNPPQQDTQKRNGKRIR